VFEHTKRKASPLCESHRRSRAVRVREHGTIYLDEIADLPSPSRPSFYMSFRTSVSSRVGGHGMIDVDIRVVRNESLPRAYVVDVSSAGFYVV